MTGSRFDKNIELLSRIIPGVALKLPYVDCTGLDFSKTRQGELNLTCTDKDQPFHYHSSYSAKKEADKWFQGLSLEGINVLYVFGTGLGYYFDAAKDWLSESRDHYLVFLENDMRVLHRLLETEKGSELLEHKQVQIHFFDNLETSEAMFHWLTWYFVLLPIEMSCLRAYEAERSSLFQELKLRVMHDTVVNDSLAGEYMRHSQSFFRNFYNNMLRLPESFHGNRLFGAFKGVPAIICGAGPSLNKQIPLLKELKDRALIFAGGSAMNAVTGAGLSPHFGAGIDPNPAQYERIISNAAFEVPYFYRNRMFHEAFLALHGDSLYLNGCGGYPVAEWMEFKLGLEGEVIAEGHNVIHFLVEIARSLGCGPIIFVGMDLAFTGKEAYASGIVGESSMKDSELKVSQSLHQGSFPRKDIYGNEVYTLWKWVQESEWMTAYAQEYSELTYINATEGGIGFEGIPNKTLKEVAEEVLTEECDLGAWVAAEISNADLKDISHDRILELFKELYDSLKVCSEHSQTIIEEAAIVKQRLKKGKTLVDSLQTGKSALAETELLEEVAYQVLLDNNSSVCAKIMERRGHEIRYDRSIRSDRERNLEMLELNVSKFRFIKEAADVNLELIEKAVRSVENLGRDTTVFHREKAEI